jgi:hypothetical protein
LRRVDGSGRLRTPHRAVRYDRVVQKRIFWLIFTVLGLAADFMLPFWWAVAATFPILLLSWWIAYRSDWF